MSISRQFARFTSELRYEDLSDPVVDKVKALLLHALVGVILGKKTRDADALMKLVQAEEARADGATILFDGSRASRVGAAFANATLIYSSQLFDSYRMITHPGVSLVPSVLASAELEGSTGRQVIEALAAGYEFLCRLCDDVIPSVAAHGFRPSPLFCTLGSAVAAGKLLKLDESRLVAAIAIAANSASGLNEGPRSGGSEMKFHEATAARSGTFAALLARYSDLKVSEEIIEGPAGFLNAFTGSNKGDLTYSFNGKLKFSLDTILERLGVEFRLLTVMFRMYSSAGYNQPVIDLLTEMVKAHELIATDIESTEIHMNWLETLYPSPNFPRKHLFIGSTEFFAAHALVNGGVPVVGGRTFGPTGERLGDDNRVIDFMQERIRIIPEKERPMFSPSVTITLKSGRKLKGDYPYSRLAWNFNQLVERLSDCFPDPSPEQDVFKKLVKSIELIDQEESIRSIIDLVQSSPR